MSIFEDRERAAEYGFTHAEELRFLAIRAGIEALTNWAADRLGYAPSVREGYVEAAIGRFVSGENETGIIGEVRADLDRAGQAERGDEAASVFARETAAAADRLYGRHSPDPAGSRAASGPEPHRAEHYRHEFWGWSV